MPFRSSARRFHANDAVTASVVRSGASYPLNATVNEGSISWVISAFADGEITMIDSSGAVKALPGARNGSGPVFLPRGSAAHTSRSEPACPPARCTGPGGKWGLMPSKYRAKGPRSVMVLCLSGFPAECRSSP